MSDRIIRQAFRLLQANQFGNLNDTEIVDWYYAILDAIKAREGTYRLESQEIVAGELAMVWWDPCPECLGKPEDVSTCRYCEGNGIVNAPNADVGTYFENIKAMGGQLTTLSSKDELSRLKDALQQLGGDVFIDEWLSDEHHSDFSVIVYVPTLIQQYHSQKAKNSECSSSEVT